MPDARSGRLGFFAMTPFRLWIGGYGPESGSHGRGLATFRDHVVQATDEEVIIDVTWNIMDEGRPNTDLLALVESGEMFLCYFSTTYLGDRVDELNILETPFLFPDLDAAHRSLDGPLGDRLRRAIRESTPFASLGFWDNGFRHVTNRLRPIHTPEDCSGMSVRVQPNAVHEELVRCWGATPVAVGLNEGIEMIASGQVDAQENPLANTVAYGVHRIHSYLTMSGHLYGARALLVNRMTYDSLSDELREIVDGAARRAIAAQRHSAEEAEVRLRGRLETEGLEVVDLSDEGRAAFVAASQPAVALARSMVPDDLHQLVPA